MTNRRVRQPRIPPKPQTALPAALLECLAELQWPSIVLQVSPTETQRFGGDEASWRQVVPSCTWIQCLVMLSQVSTQCVRLRMEAVQRAQSAVAASGIVLPDGTPVQQAPKLVVARS